MLSSSLRIATKQCRPHSSLWLQGAGYYRVAWGAMQSAGLSQSSWPRRSVAGDVGEMAKRTFDNDRKPDQNLKEQAKEVAHDLKETATGAYNKAKEKAFGSDSAQELQDALTNRQNPQTVGIDNEELDRLRQRDNLNESQRSDSKLADTVEKIKDTSKELYEKGQEFVHRSGLDQKLSDTLSKAQELAHQGKEKVKEVYEEVKEKGVKETMQEMAHEGKEKMQQAAEQVKEKAQQAVGSAQDKAKDMAHNAQETSQELWRDAKEEGFTQTAKNLASQGKQKLEQGAQKAKETLQQATDKSRNAAASSSREASAAEPSEPRTPSPKHAASKHASQPKTGKKEASNQAGNSATQKKSKVGDVEVERESERLASVPSSRVSQQSFNETAGGDINTFDTKTGESPRLTTAKEDLLKNRDKDKKRADESPKQQKRSIHSSCRVEQHPPGNTVSERATGMQYQAADKQSSSASASKQRTYDPKKPDTSKDTTDSAAGMAQQAVDKMTSKVSGGAEKVQQNFKEAKNDVKEKIAPEVKGHSPEFWAGAAGGVLGVMFMAYYGLKMSRSPGSGPTTSEARNVDSSERRKKNTA